MTEKHHCGQCGHFYHFYCSLRNIQVSYNGYTCNVFEWKGDVE